MKVTFINEMADLCERVGADVHDVARGIGLDGRIGRKFLHPGPGYGGSCFPKDTLALARIAQDWGAPSRLVEATVAVNDARKQSMAARVIAACGGSVRGRTVAVLGLAFKPETDDMREAPSIPIVHGLVEAGAAIRAFDPASVEQARPLLPDGITYCRNAVEALDGADALVLVTEWNEFRALSPALMAASLSSRVVVDLRNAFDPRPCARPACATTRSAGRGWPRRVPTRRRRGRRRVGRFPRPGQTVLLSAGFYRPASIGRLF